MDDPAFAVRGLRYRVARVVTAFETPAHSVKSTSAAMTQLESSSGASD